MFDSTEKRLLHICGLVLGPAKTIMLSGQTCNVMKHFKIDINREK